MKKSLLALAALGAFAGTAQAQSSVTLYGVVDANIEYVSNMSSTAAGTAGFPGRGENKFGGDLRRPVRFALGSARRGRSRRRHEGAVRARKRLRRG
ncbi:hypothetical protein OJJOAM_002245 [Cupriavidus sp. H18C1]